MEYRHLLVKDEPPVARMTLNRPDKRNALSVDLMEEVVAALNDLGGRADVRAIVIDGAGPAFSAGHDLAELLGKDLPFYQQVFDLCTIMMETIHRVPQPVIAKVHGVATAAGCQLVASCDLAVSTDDARFATPGVKIGLFCSTPMVPVTRAVGRKRAMQLLLTGDFIDAPTAVSWGLINEAVSPGELDGAVDRLVQAIVRSSPLVVGMGKEAFYAQIDLDEHGAYEHTKAVMSANMMAADAREGIGAFLEKRQPDWKGA